MEVQIMPGKKIAKLSKREKKPAAKQIKANSKKYIPASTKEEVKVWKNSKKINLSLIEVETMFEDAFEAVDRIWINNLTPLITKLDSISSELTQMVNEFRQRDIQTKYTEYDKIKDTIISRNHLK
jgi:hypothetical protein